ncbi:MAG: TonB family protein [Nitrospinae bacterium]|nr:TonB family protein [Nitrospinota bacterium]
MAAASTAAPQPRAARERDLNSARQLVGSLGVSAIAHLAFIIGFLLVEAWSPKPRLVVPGYHVNLVTMQELRPGSLLEPESPGGGAVPEKPAPPLKEAGAPPVMKKTIEPVKKAEPEAKKIMPVGKEGPKLPEKKEPEAPRKEIAAPGGGGGPGAGGGPRKTIVTEGVAFPHLWYLQIVERKVRDNWITHGVDISTKRADPVVRFSIGRDGRVTESRLERPSGSEPLDESALGAVSMAGPFPPLPEDYPASALTIYFAFSYEQKD